MLLCLFISKLILWILLSIFLILYTKHKQSCFCYLSKTMMKCWNDGCKVGLTHHWFVGWENDPRLWWNGTTSGETRPLLLVIGSNIMASCVGCHANWRVAWLGTNLNLLEKLLCNRPLLLWINYSVWSQKTMWYLQHCLLMQILLLHDIKWLDFHF